MLLNHLKISLPKGWEDQFRHHESYPEDYYDVAEVELDLGEKKVLVLNRNTNDLMEYYYDDIPDDQWISLKKVLKSERNIDCDNYFINKKYEIYNLKNKLIRKLESNTHLRDNYPRISFSIKNKREVLLTHRLIAIIFVPNVDPLNFNIVNHKNTITSDVTKINLEWSNYSYNNLSKNRKKRESRFYYTQLDINGNIIKIWDNIEELKKTYPKYKQVLHGNKLYKGYYWKRIDSVLEDYKSRHLVVDNGWYTNFFITTHKVEANLCGILRVNGVETIGVLDNNRLYYRIRIGSSSYLTHRLIYETISGKKIDEKNVIDHIQPVRSVVTINNEYSNLRETTYSGNMNNPETIKTLVKNSYKEYDLYGNFIREYKSLKEINTVKKGNRNIFRGLSSTNTIYGSLWCISGNENKIKSDINKIYYRFSNSGKLEYSSINFISTLSIKKKGVYIVGKLYNDYKKYLNTGMPAPDGYYYQQGNPNNMLYDPNNTKLISKRKEIK